MKQDLTDLTLDDFFTGLLAALADKGIFVLAVRDNSFYSAVRASYEKLYRLAEVYHLDCRFAIFLDPLYGDSSIIREGISGAVMRDLAALESFNFRDLRIKCDGRQAEALLQQLPGSPDLYDKAAAAFLDTYSDAA